MGLTQILNLFSSSIRLFLYSVLFHLLTKKHRGTINNLRKLADKKQLTLALSMYKVYRFHAVCLRYGYL